MQPKQPEKTLSQKIEGLSHKMLKLDTGSLAELRRMDLNGSGPTAFWNLACRCGFLDGNTDNWMQIVKIMAILTPKGTRDDRHRLHDSKNRLGATLCDGGVQDWPSPGSERRELVSEARLARFLSGPPCGRGEALERLARMLAAKRDPNRGIDCTAIAELILAPDNETAQRNIARDYYRRLDGATQKTEQKEAAE